MNDISEKLKSARVAPVIRTSTEDAARHAVDLLAEEGFDLFEITLTTPGAMGIIRDLARDPALTIGVGTVLTADQGRSAMDAGASFVVSPAFVPGLVSAGGGIPVALGAATPTEALRAHEDGAAFVKVFPAAQLGGPGFVKALRSVYPMIDIMPTGGIEPDNLSAYFAAGAVCCGMGGKLVSDAALQAGNDDAIRVAARAVRAALA
jgi:2-dehydro-3-deoxyphosphogluconate aldolase/(4S)-4-hydroxy-2-oxoglutarate aldolase